MERIKLILENIVRTVIEEHLFEIKNHETMVSIYDKILKKTNSIKKLSILSSSMNFDGYDTFNVIMCLKENGLSKAHTFMFTVNV
jgi:NAD-specific glutamate dehydrogenase